MRGERQAFGPLATKLQVWGSLQEGGWFVLALLVLGARDALCCCCSNLALTVMVRRF